MIHPYDEEKVLAGYNKLARMICESDGRGSARVKLRAARTFLGLTQKDFALKFGVSLDTVKSWEAESRAEPIGIARLLIEMISDNPHRAVLIAESLTPAMFAESPDNDEISKMELG
jgi:DNA-binding transcriptional regulator YiaG